MRLHHIGLVVDSIMRKADLYHQSLGFALTTEIVTDPIQKVKIAFAEIGDGIFIEFIEPLGPDSPVAQFLKRGGGLYHLCYVVQDIEEAVERVRQTGGLIVSPPVPARAFNDRRIAFVYTSDGSLVEFLEE